MTLYKKTAKLSGPYAALIGSLLIALPSSLAQSSEPASGGPLRLTVAPQTASRVAMKTLPNAVCKLHSAGESNPAHSFTLFSDDEGTVRFEVTPSEESNEVAAYAVDCSANGQTARFALELRANASPTLEMPSPREEKRIPKASDFIRPALTKAEALELSDEEMAKREFPVRPDRTQAPGAFDAWLQAVTHPARRVSARQVADPEARASAWELSGGWSGFDLKTAPNEIPTSTYDLVEGEWTVPTVSQSHIEQNTTTYSFFWIGLDGDNNICPAYCPSQGQYQDSDLWQAGTLQDVTNYHYGPFGIFWDTFSTYNAWSEFIPGQSVEVLPNFNVSPGDTMFSEVYVANAGGAPSLSGLFAIAFIEDMTKSEYTWVYNCRGLTMDGNCTATDQIPILGYQAEWILERPYMQGAISDLADYGQAWMYYPYAEQINGAWDIYNGANSQDIWMYNSSTGDLLSVPYVWDSTTIQYIWYNFH
jgi:hypothetical protein